MLVSGLVVIATLVAINLLQPFEKLRKWGMFLKKYRQIDGVKQCSARYVMRVDLIIN
jgi:hypothetical protein